MSEFNERISLLDELTKSRGYEIALLTTFNFDVEYFERAILNRFMACGTRKVSLYMDAKELAKSLSAAQSSGIGRRYIVNPIEMNAAFHPKVALLIGKNGAKLIVGSSNIKASGYEINNEVFNTVYFDKENTASVGIVRDAFSFFQQLDELSYGLDSGVIEEAEKMLPLSRSNSKEDDIRFVHNINASILSQVRRMIGGRVKKINIAVPYYDKRLEALKEVKKVFNTANIRLYIQDETSTFPVKLNRKESLVKDVNVFHGFNDTTSETSTNFYHGKVFSFILDRECYMLYGSANCTLSALCKSYEQGGNIEGCFLERCRIKDQDRFFRTIDVDNDAELTSNSMVYDKSVPGNYYYKYGEYDEQIELVIGYKRNEPDARIFVNDIEVDYSSRDGVYIIQPDETAIGGLQSIFDIRIEYGKTVEHLLGWYVNRIEVLQNRANINEKVIELHFDRNAEDDKYKEDIIRIFRAFSLCLPGLSEYRKTVAALQQFQNEREGEGADDEEESYILDIDIPDVYRAQYKQYSEIDRLQRNILTSFNSNVFLSMPLRLSRESDGKTGNESARASYRKGDKREPSSSDKRFVRFIRSQVKKINTPEFAEQIDVGRFLSIVALFLDIFNKYRGESKSEGVFALDYIIIARTTMLQNVIAAYNRDDGGIQKQTEESLELLIVDTLLDNHLLISENMELEVHAKYENMNRELLIAADKALSIRERNVELIERLFAGKRANGLTKRKANYSSYLDNLFGYKDDNMLVTLVKEIYGSDAQLQIDNHVATVTAYTDSIVDHWVPSVELLRELNRYSHNVYTIITTRIKVHNVAKSMGNNNPTMEIVHLIDMIYRKRATTSTRKNGEVRMEKSTSGAF